MVGRLVQDEEAGLPLDRRGELQTVALSSGQGAYRLVQVVPPEQVAAQRSQDRLPVPQAHGEEGIQDRLLLLQRLLMLGAVADRQARADPQHRVLPVSVRDDVAQQGALAAPVRTDQREPFAAGDLQVSVPEQHAVAEAPSVADHLQRDVRPALGLRQHHGDGRVLHVGPRHGPVLLPRELSAPRPQALAVRLVGAHRRDGSQAGDQRLELGEPLLRCDVVGPLGHQCLQPGQLVVGVVPRVLPDAASLELQDARDGAVEQAAVVRHQQHGSRKGDERLLQPLQAGVVQVVARLVQNQQPRVHHQRAGERQQVPFAAGELPHGRRAGMGQSDVLQDAIGLPACLVAAGRVIPIPGRLVALQGIGHLPVGGLRKGALGSPQRLLHGRHLTQQEVPHLHRRRDFQLLRHMPDLEVGAHHDVARAGPLRAQQQVQDRGLAGAVRPDQPYPVTGIDLERDVRQDIMATVMLGYMVKAHHGLALPGRTPRQTTIGVAVRTPRRRAEAVAPPSPFLNNDRR